MKKLNIGIFLSLLLMVGLCSCGEQKSNTKLVLNEVLIENESNFQDDYGVHSAWIEIFNRSFGSADLAGCLLKVSSQPGDTATYFIPKGDVLTLVKPRQHALFWADGEPNRGTFHTNFTLNAATDNWIGLYDSGKKLLDQIIVPAGTLQANQSYARVSAPNYIKIDLSIIRSIDTDANKRQIVSNTVSYAHQRGMKVVAEGLETADEVRTVLSLGVDLLQGFFLAMPQVEPGGASEESLAVIAEMHSQSDESQISIFGGDKQ